jgi:MFS transporter, UMF1 family
MTFSWKDKRLWGWAMYDFANSAFATTILAVVFNVYFVRHVVPPEGIRWGPFHAGGAALWGYAVSFSMFLIFLAAPLLGAVADATRRKKAFLFAFATTGALASALMALVAPGRVALGLGLFVVGNIGFAGGNIFYNAFLPDLGRREDMGKISGLGWAVGYLGGGLCLAMNLLMIDHPGSFGIPTAGQWPVRVALASAGVWWLVFAVPFWRWVPERHDGERESLSDGEIEGWRGGEKKEIRKIHEHFMQGIARLKETARNIRAHRNLALFLAAYLLYNDGIETIILMASVVGAELLGMSAGDLVLCFLMIQGVAFLGALAYGPLVDRFRHKPVLAGTLALYTAVILWAVLAMKTTAHFWGLGAAVGLILGGSQAVSRSFMALLTPRDKSAEFFSFYGLTGKLTAVLGPLVFGMASHAAGLRAAMLSLLVFFLGGGAVLWWVREPEITKNASS